MKRTCSECNQAIIIHDRKTYDDLWYTWTPGEKIVHLHCPNNDCTLVPGSLGTEPLKPERHVIPFGKYRGQRLSEIKDSSYLDWLSTNEDSFLKALIALVE